VAPTRRRAEIAFDASKVKTKAQWVRAGELVFNAPTSFNAESFSAENLHDPGILSPNRVWRHAKAAAACPRSMGGAAKVVELLGSMGCSTCREFSRSGAVVPRRARQ
jgi:hypothetical protein